MSQQKNSRLALARDTGCFGLSRQFRGRKTALLISCRSERGFKTSENEPRRSIGRAL